MQIPVPFTPLTCAEMLAHFLDTMPLLASDLKQHLKQPGAMDRIVSLEARGLVQYAVSADGQPAVFIAPMADDTAHPYASFEERAFADQLVSYFDTTGQFDARDGKLLSNEQVEAAGVGAALLDFINNRMSPEKPWINPILNQRSKRLQIVRQLTGLTKEEVDGLTRGVITGDAEAKLQTWGRKVRSDRDYASMMTQMLTMGERAIPPLPPSHMPHWQMAMEKKSEAIAHLQLIEQLPPDHPTFNTLQWRDLQEDLTALRAADMYSFNADTMHAIMMGAQSIPHESTLQSVEIPASRAGWFWFAQPYPVASSPMASDTTAAVLWSWDTKLKTPALRFSAYVIDVKGNLLGKILPSTKWIWPLDLTFHDMIGLNTQLYRNAYGPGGPFHEQKFMIGEGPTMAVIAELSLFFLMSCLWFKQTVPGRSTLTLDPAHIERHARKRYEREYKQTPIVRVVALRKSAVTAHEPIESEEGGQHLHVRFVVSGHARLQAYGPGRTERKLIWISPFMKGPEGAPFKESAPRVFAVVR